MLKHTMMYKLKDAAEGRGKAENAALIKTWIDALKETIPGIRSIEVGINTAQIENAYDMVVLMEFDGRREWEVFLPHPEHVALGRRLDPLRESSVVVDYEC